MAKWQWKEDNIPCYFVNLFGRVTKFCGRRRKDTVRRWGKKKGGRRKEGGN